MNFEDFEDIDIEEIRGKSKKKKVGMDILNSKRKLSSFELDELFLGDE